MTLITSRMSTTDAVFAVANGNSEAEGILLGLINLHWHDKSKRSVLELCDKHGVTGAAVCGLYSGVCEEYHQLMLLILTMEESGIVKFNIARHVGNASGRKTLRDAFSRNKFVQVARTNLLVLH